MVIARDPLGIPAAVLRDRRAAVGRGERERGAVEPGLLAREHPLARAGRDDHGRAAARSSIEQFADSPRRAHCFFEWIYFANVASTLDDRSVYLARKALGEELARLEDVPLDDDTIVVPVPDTSKCAADAMAYRLGVPSAEGLIRNRYTGRTFIEGTDSRVSKAAAKYTPLREVLEGKRVLLVEDSIVRSTTMRVLISRIRDGRPGARDSRPRGLPADHRAVLLRHRHVDRLRAVRPALHADGRPQRGSVRRDGARPGRRFAAVLADRVDRPRHRPAGRRAVPGVHHRPLSDAARPEALPDRTDKREVCPASDASGSWPVRTYEAAAGRV